MRIKLVYLDALLMLICTERAYTVFLVEHIYVIITGMMFYVTRGL